MQVSEETKDLLFAIGKNDSTMVQKLLEDGRADPTALDNSAIRLSARNGYDKVVKLLLDWVGPNGIRVDPAALHNSAIQSSARNGHDKVVKLLLEDGRADPAEEDNYAIQAGAEHGHDKVVQLLL